MKSLFTFLLLAVVVGQHPVSGQSADDLFQQALTLERAQGDFKGAIALYEQIVQEYPGSRTIAARSLLQLGKAYERSGRDDARAAYERLVRDYADQGELVAEARVRMRGLVPEPAVTPADQNVMRYPFPYREFPALVSNSGRHVVQNNDDGGYDLLELETGTIRNLASDQSGCPDGLGWPMAFSPDDSMIAFQCSYNRPNFISIAAGVYDMRTGATMEVVSAEAYFGITDSTSKHMAIAVPFDWSEDGRSLLVKLWNVTEWSAKARGAWAKQTMDVGLFPIDGGAPTVISHLVDGPIWDPFLFGACLLRNDRVLITQYSVPDFVKNGEGSRGQIRSTDVTTGTERIVRDAESSSFSVFGCDRKSGRVYYRQNPRTQDFQSDRPSLWMVDVNDQGDFTDQQLVQSLPTDVKPMVSYGGRVVYIETIGSKVSGIFQAELDPRTGRMASDPRLLEAMGGSTGHPEAISTDGRQLLWTHWPTGDRRVMERFVSEDGGPFTPMNLRLGPAAMLAIDGDRLVHSDSAGTFVSNWKTGKLLETLATRFYRLASTDLRFLYRLDGQELIGERIVDVPVDGPRCVLVLDRTSGKEETHFCIQVDASDSHILRVDPASGRASVSYRDLTDRRNHSLEVYDPATGSSVPVIQGSHSISTTWAGGRLHVSHGYPRETFIFDPTTGVRKPLDLDRIQETVSLESNTFRYMVSPDERRMFFYGQQIPSGIEVVVMKDPQAGTR